MVEFEIEIAPEVQKEADDALTVVETAVALEIRSEEHYLHAGTLAVDIQTMKRSLEDRLDTVQEPMRESKRQADKAMKEARKLFDPWLLKLEAAGTRLAKIMSDFRLEQKRQTRLLAEQREAEARAQAKEEAAKRAEVARVLKDKGLADEAKAILSRPVQVVAPIATYTPPPPKVTGVVATTKKAAKVDLQAQYGWLKQAVENWNGFHLPEKQVVPADFWLLDKDALDDRAAQTDGMVPIPGVEFYEVEKTVVRRRR